MRNVRLRQRWHARRAKEAGSHRVADSPLLLVCCPLCVSPFLSSVLCPRCALLPCLRLSSVADQRCAQEQDRAGDAEGRRTARGNGGHPAPCAWLAASVRCAPGCGAVLSLPVAGPAGRRRGTCAAQRTTRSGASTPNRHKRNRRHGARVRNRALTVSSCTHSYSLCGIARWDGRALMSPSPCHARRPPSALMLLGLTCLMRTHRHSVSCLVLLIPAHSLCVPHVFVWWRRCAHRWRRWPLNRRRG
jgi:hypothetical protein